MEEFQLKEKEYLKGVYKGILPRYNPFIIPVGDGKEMSVISPRENDFAQNLDKISKYRSLYDVVLDLKSKISFSLDETIEKAYSKEVLDNYDTMSSLSKEEWFAYYYIENALFRIETLWDILAQIYNVKYGLRLDKKEVYHNRIFSKEERWISKYWENGIPDEIMIIANYLSEDDGTETTEDMWKGNYKYVNSLRNDMTHKITIAQNLFSSYSFSFKVPLAYVLKRVTECYAKLESFVYEACENIMDESEDFVSICSAEKYKMGD